MCRVELRPADEGVSATMFVCLAEDSDITGSSFNDVGDVHCQRQSLQRRERFDSERYPDPIVASALADPPYITEVVVTGDVELTVFLDAAWTEGSVVTGHVCTGASVSVLT